MKESEALKVLKDMLDNGDNLFSEREALKVAIETLTPTEEKTPANIKEACEQVSGAPLDYFLAGMSYYKANIWHGNEDLPAIPKENRKEIPIVFVSQFYGDNYLRKGLLIYDVNGGDSWSAFDDATGDSLEMDAVDKWCYADDINLKLEGDE